MARVLVLGAGGMLGHKLCQMLPQMGFEVVATARKPAEFYQRYGDLFSGVELIGGVDATDFTGMEAVIRRCEPD
ncbi:MAG: SDR family NAD(P)-dependent oxidoreductase, partial [bacterium]|nr:SDR family NAD(P)-dependent oxidoreductase [bacterium]